LEGFVTLSKSGEEIRPYLTGEFSSEYSAIPVRSMNYSPDAERVTFNIIKRKPIHFFSRISSYLKLMRLEILPLTLGPLFFIWLNYSGNSTTELLLNFIGLALAHGGIFALNDYSDYVSGIDRIKEKGGTRVLINGFIRAVDAKRFAYALLSVAALAAIPLIYAYPEVLVIAFAGLALGIFGHKRLRIGISVFMAFGPLLVSGAALSLGVHWSDIVSTSDFYLLSLFHGLGALLYLHVRQFATLMDDHRSKNITFATRLGFDRTKTILVVESALLVFIGLALRPGAFILLASVLLGLTMIFSIRRIKTSLSSPLAILPSMVLCFVASLTFLLAFNYFWRT
jgi:1,4-dihydroxy-2-naphthoate octaprenyltransferase